MEHQISTHVNKPTTMMIKNLCPGLQEVGKIKIGNKGEKRRSQGGSEWQPPQKLDHFLITTLERGADGNYIVDERLQKQFGGEGCKSIPVRLIYDDIALNFASRYICYYGKKVFCSGDGEEAQRMRQDGSYATRSCPCERQDPKYNGDNGPNGPDCIGGTNSKGKCKINGILSVIIDGADSVGGVWKFRTTSYNTVVGIMSSLALISRITGGRLAGIPLNMTVSPKTTQDPIGGGQVTVYVVGLTFAGNMETLRNTGYQIAMDEAKHGISMKEIESRAMVMLSHVLSSGGIGDDLDQDVVEEFYPEEVADPAPPLAAAQEVPVLPQVQVQEAEVVPPPRKRGEPGEGRKRRTAAEMEEDRLADERDAAAAQGQATASPLTTCPCEHPVTSFDETTGMEVCDSCGVTLEAEPGFEFPDVTEHQPAQVTGQQVEDSLGKGASREPVQQQAAPASGGVPDLF